LDGRLQRKTGGRHQLPQVVYLQLAIARIGHGAIGTQYFQKATAIYRDIERILAL
jgi:hypothetical protein